VWAAALASSVLAAEDAANRIGMEENFVRILRTKAGTPEEMQTSIVRMTNGKTGDEEIIVDLVSAIHVGDRAYYEKLNERFTQYEALLYELVAEEGMTPAQRPKDGGGHPIAALQDGLKNLLNLEHQLAIVDYEKKNFVHADLSPEDFNKAMKERGESFMTMFLRLAFEGMKQPQGRSSDGDDLKMLMALMSPNRPMALKRIMADQFEQIESISAGLDGPKGSAIVTDRNSKALEVLKKSLESGKRKVGIFYGAAHMPDMQRRLTDDFGMSRGGIEWLTAWNMKEPESQSEFLKQLEKNRKARQKKKAA
jgi:hypothetical protein